MKPTAIITALLTCAFLLPVAAAGAEPEEVTLKARDGFQLAATYHPPAQERAACVVLLHMLGGKRQDWAPLVPRLTEAGYAVLAVDFRAHGESKAGGKLDIEKLSEQKMQALGPALALDVAAAVAFLETRPEADASRIAFVAASIGANLALNHAARHAEVKALALLSPGLDYLGVTTKEAMKQRGKRPILLLASRPDTDSAECVEVLAKLTKEPGVESRVFETPMKLGSDGTPVIPHGTDLMAAEAETVPAVVKFLGTAMPAVAGEGGGR